MSMDCFRLGWPMHVDADFFWVPSIEQSNFDKSNELLLTTKLAILLCLIKLVLFFHQSFNLNVNFMTNYVRMA
ncbi:hypothetical protein AAHE18_16G164200 [Arachis hypogaea]